jgi:CRISPR-associated protein Cas2
MNMRRLVLVCYDIRNPKRLRHVHMRMKGFGDPLQYSVFLCDLEERGRILLRATLEEEMNLAQDRALIVDLGPVEPSTRDRISSLGADVPLPAHQARIV